MVHNFDIGSSSKSINLETQVEEENTKNIEELFETREDVTIEERVEVSPSLNDEENHVHQMPMETMS